MNVVGALTRLCLRMICLAVVVCMRRTLTETKLLRSDRIKRCRTVLNTRIRLDADGRAKTCLLILITRRRLRKRNINDDVSNKMLRQCNDNRLFAKRDVRNSSNLITLLCLEMMILQCISRRLRKTGLLRNRSDYADVRIAVIVITNDSSAVSKTRRLNVLRSIIMLTLDRLRQRLRIIGLDLQRATCNVRFLRANGIGLLILGLRNRLLRINDVRLCRLLAFTCIITRLCGGLISAAKDLEDSVILRLNLCNACVITRLVCKTRYRLDRLRNELRFFNFGNDLYYLALTTADDRRCNRNRNYRQRYFSFRLVCVFCLFFVS